MNFKTGFWATGGAIAFAVLALSSPAKARVVDDRATANFAGRVWTVVLNNGRLNLLTADLPSSVPTDSKAKEDGTPLTWSAPTLLDGFGRSTFQNGVLTTATDPVSPFYYPISATQPAMVKTGVDSASFFYVQKVQNASPFVGSATLVQTPSGVAVKTNTFGGYNPAFRLHILPGANQIGAAPLPDNSVITAHATPQKNIDLWFWDMNASVSQSGFRDALYPERSIRAVPLPAGLSPANWDGNVDAAIGKNLFDSNADPARPYNLWLALRSTSGVGYVGCARLGLGGDLSPQGVTWTQVTTGKDMQRSRLISDPLNQVVLSFSNRALDRYRRRQVALNGSPARIQIGEKIGDQNIGDSGEAPFEVYSFGRPSSPPATTTNIPVLVPAFRNWIYTNLDGSVYAVTTNMGQAKRSQQIQVAEAPSQQKFPLVGIIEGPPPVPNENVRDSFADIIMGRVTYGKSQTGTSETSYEASLGLVAKAEGAGGVPLIGHAEFEAEGSVVGSMKWQDETVQTVQQTYSGVAKTHKPRGATQSEIYADGVAFLLQSGYAGFSYTFVDMNGVEVPGATNLLQLWPTKPHLVAYAFSFDPKASQGVIPGQLATYLVDQQTLDEVCQNSALSVDADNDAKTDATNYIETAWTTAGGSAQEISSIAKNSFSGGVDVELQFLVGGTAGDKNLGNYLEAKAGVKMGFKYDRTTGKETEEKLSCEVDTASSDDAGSYTAYTFRTMLLKENSFYTDELLARVNSYNDPAQNNLSLASKIMPGSTPWKITYGIVRYADGTGDFHQIPPDSGPAAGLGAITPLGALPIPASLGGAGITSHQDLGLLAASVRHLDAHKARANAPLALAAPLKGVSPQIARLAATLTPIQRADLMNHLRAQQAVSLRSWLQKNPNWRPRAFPHPATNAPNLKDVFAPGGSKNPLPHPREFSAVRPGFSPGMQVSTAPVPALSRAVLGR